jgi:hypothetical protein
MLMRHMNSIAEILIEEPEAFEPMYLERIWKGKDHRECCAGSGILLSRSCGRRLMVLQHSGAMYPKRIPLSGFPDVVLHAEESSAKRYPQFAAAKAGDIVAAGTVVAEFINSESVGHLRVLLGDRPAELLPVHALEVDGVNEIPVALARELGRRLGIPVNTSVVQLNAVGHTGADGFHRLANQALFEGIITSGARYLVVDDFVAKAVRWPT